jgi:hypothetical protein
MYLCATVMSSNGLIFICHDVILELSLFLLQLIDVWGRWVLPFVCLLLQLHFVHMLHPRGEHSIVGQGTVLQAGRLRVNFLM